MKTTYNVLGGGVDLTGLSKAELFNTVVSFADEMHSLVNELNQSRIEVVGTYLNHGDIALAMCEGTLIEYVKTVCETMTQQLEEHLEEDLKEFKFYEYTITKVEDSCVSTTDIILGTSLKANLFTTDKVISCSLEEYLYKCGVLKDFTDGYMSIIEVNNLLISNGILPIKSNYARFGKDFMDFNDLMENAKEYSDIEPVEYLHGCFLSDELNNGRTFGEWLDFLQGLSN